MLVIEPFANNN